MHIAAEVDIVGVVEVAPVGQEDVGREAHEAVGRPGGRAEADGTITGTDERAGVVDMDIVRGFEVEAVPALREVGVAGRRDLEARVVDQVVAGEGAAGEPRR